MLQEAMADVINAVCSYVQTEDDMQMIDELRESLSESPLDGKTLAAFARCDERYNLNSYWMKNTGELIVLWIRSI